MGVLGHSLGTYLTISGIRQKKDPFSLITLVVDRINGVQLNSPVQIRMANSEKPWLPDNTRCTLNGYETGRMVGAPPAILKIHGGQDPLGSSTYWHFQNEFVITSSVKPTSIKFKSRNY